MRDRKAASDGSARKGFQSYGISATRFILPGKHTLELFEAWQETGPSLCGLADDTRWVSTVAAAACSHYVLPGLGPPSFTGLKLENPYYRRKAKPGPGPQGGDWEPFRGNPAG